MKNFTRILTAVMLLCMALMLCACAEPDPTTTSSTATEPSNQPPQPTETEPTQTTSDGLVEYTVTVLYPDGTPVANASVQICTADGMCYMPARADENGVLVSRLEEMQGYKARINGKIEGYQEMAADEYIYFEGDSKELTITLVPEA